MRVILVGCEAAFLLKTIRFSRGNAKAPGQKIRAAAAITLAVFASIQWLHRLSKRQ
jgi:hypothetical protein